MQKLNALSRCLTPLEPDGTLIAVIEIADQPVARRAGPVAGWGTGGGKRGCVARKASRQWSRSCRKSESWARMSASSIHVLLSELGAGGSPLPPRSSTNPAMTR